MAVAYVLFIEGDEKHNILRPPIYGPFESDAEAQKFVEAHPRYWDSLGDIMPFDGGYAAAHIVSAETAQDPQEALDDWAELRDD